MAGRAGGEVTDLTGGGIMQANTHLAQFTGATRAQCPVRRYAGPVRRYAGPVRRYAGSVRCTTCWGRIRTSTRSLSVPVSPVNGCPVYFWLSA